MASSEGSSAPPFYQEVTRRSRPARTANIPRSPVRIVRHRATSLLLPVAFWGGVASSVAGAADKPAPAPPTGNGAGGVAVTNTDFHGWKAIRLRSGVAEVVVVPAIGRVMRFDLLDGNGGSTAGPFWNHPKIAGNGGGTGPGNAGNGGGGGGGEKTAVNPTDDHLQPDSEGWTNYGGDKAWPAPQSEWTKVAGRGWPPPKGFDALPYTASLKGDKVQLVSAVDPDYGVRVRRTIGLDPRNPVMTIETAYEKVRGRVVSVGVWTITQLDAPARLFIWLPPRHESPAFARGYNNLLPDAAQGLNVEGRLLMLGRDPRNKTMINSDGHALLWVGNGPDLLIEDKTPESAGSADEWPNHGAHSQIYTSPGPAPDDKKVAQEQNTETYVELELLGRLNKLGPGGKALMRTSYTLIRRTEQDPTVEAKKVFALP